MQILLSAILPIFSVILLGYFLKSNFYRVQKFWNTLDSMNYYILMPSMLFYKVTTSNLSGSEEAIKAVLIMSASLVFISFLALFINFFTKFTPSKFTSFFQGSSRYNSYIYIAIIFSLYGTNGIAMAAVLIAFITILINILCVCIFAIYIRGGKFSFLKIAKNIVTNPIILACALGVVANYAKTSPNLISIFGLIGNAAITMGLLSIGAGLRFEYIKELKLDFYLSTFLKLVIYPVVVFWLCVYYGLAKEWMMIAVLFAAMPTATSSYILARQLGGDDRLMSLIITLQTIICPVTLWVILMLF